MNYQEIRNHPRFKDLCHIAGEIHKLDEDLCNYPDIDHAITISRDRLVEAANKIAASVFALNAYHQPDPRGCSLYLVSDADNNDQTYTHGIAVIEPEVAF